MLELALAGLISIARREPLESVAFASEARRSTLPPGRRIAGVERGEEWAGQHARDRALLRLVGEADRDLAVDNSEVSSTERAHG